MFSRRAILTGATACLLPSAGWGQENWPNKAINLLVPFPAGPAVDFVARQVGQKLAERYRRNVVIENRTGANGAIAATAIARAQPDGYSLMIGTAGTHATAVHMMANLPYDPVRDFTPIIAAVEPVTCLVVNAKLPVNSVAELVSYAKARPGVLSYGSSGTGSVFHLMGEMFNRMTGVEIMHVPYRGVEPAMNDVRANHIPMTYISISNALAAAEAGEVRILAVLEPQRFAKYPDIPSMSELIKGFEKPSSWFGFLGPAGLSTSIVEKLNGDIQDILTSAEIKARLEGLGLAVMGGSSQSFAALIKSGIAVYGELFRQAGISPQ